MNFYGCWKKAKTVQFCYNNGSGEYKSLRENVTEDTLVLPSMCSPKGYTFLGWSNEPDQHGYPDYLMGEKITVSSGMKLYSVLIENPVPGPNTAAVSEAYDEIFFIGDSRTVGMKKWVNAQGEPVSSKATFYCKNGAGMDWYLENRSQIINGIKKTEGKKAVIWCLGANNLCYTTQSGYLQSVVDTYLNELAYLKKTLQKQNAPPPQDKIALVKRNYDFVYKGYSGKARRQIPEDKKTPTEPTTPEEPESAPAA